MQIGLIWMIMNETKKMLGFNKFDITLQEVIYHVTIQDNLIRVTTIATIGILL